MSRLWVKVMKNHRIAQQEAEACAWGEEKEVLVELCKRLDLPCPMWLSKHESEFNRFRRTAFIPEHFVEAIDFDRLKIEYLDDTDKGHKSDDPRNQF